MLERRNCRNFYKELRNALSQEVVARKSNMICEQILASDDYKYAKVILGYYPLGNEVNCLPVIEQALLDSKSVALPRTADEGQMDFYEIHALTDVEEGTFHIMEPKKTCARLELLTKDDMDSKDDQMDAEVVALVPGVVFDRTGNRYGYGRGYYDRYFARFPKLRRIALAYSKQLSEETLECLSTDMKMHMIVTEQETIKITSAMANDFMIVR